MIRRPRPAVVCAAVVTLWSLACTNYEASFLEGQWQGTCQFPTGDASSAFSLENREGWCDTCEGNFLPLTVRDWSGTGPEGDDWIYGGTFWHCHDKQGCVDQDGVELDEGYVLLFGTASAGQQSITTWMEGEVDPDSKKLIGGEGGWQLGQGVPMIGPCSFERTGSLDD